MAQVKVGGQFLEVDVMEEVSDFQWSRPRWAPDKLIAASPFRNDHAPSFYLNLDGDYAGVWGDSGAFDERYESGNLAELLAFLRNETYEETTEYLVGQYGGNMPENEGKVRIRPIKQITEHARVVLDERLLSPFAYRHAYLTNRAINERTQRFMGVGYSKAHKAITLPWRHADGSLANVKYRKTQGKTFWYQRNASPVRSLVYGIDKIYRHLLKEVIVCEAEIDALSWWSAGKPAIALGGSSLSQVQLNLIRKSPIEELVFAMDNDLPGGKLQRKLVEGLRGCMAVKTIKIPAEYKDSNEACVAGVDLAKLDVIPIRA